MKKRIKVIGIVILITILIGTNVKAFTISPTGRTTVSAKSQMRYHYEAGDKLVYSMVMYKGKDTLYTFRMHENIPISVLTNAVNYQDEICERILENGYPVKTYEKMGLPNYSEAYFATQEAIYMYLGPKDINHYIIEDETGERILNCAKQILEEAKKEEVSLKEIDSKWKVDETNRNLMYKQYRVFLASKIENANITLQDASNSKVYNTENEIVSTVNDGDIVKIVVPKGMNQKFKVKLSYEKQGVILYRCYNASDTSIEYLASKMGQVQKEKAFDIEFQELEPVTITNYDNETKEKIGGSIFSIFDKSQNIIKENIVTNEEGTIQVFLEKGDYFLKQNQTKEGYSLATEMINFTVKDKENVNVNVYNTKVKQEEINTENTQINVVEDTQKIIENQVTNVSNIHTTNIEKEITKQTNETNFENINYFTNTTYQKNIRNKQKENTYQNQMWKEIVTNEILPGENKMTNMIIDGDISYMDFINIGRFEVPNLPVALKQ